MQSQQQRENSLEKIEQNLRDLWDKKRSNICVIRVPEAEDWQRAETYVNNNNNND